MRSLFGVIVSPCLCSLQVDASLLDAATDSFATSVQTEAPGYLFAQGIVARKQEKEMAILNMPKRALVPAWEDCIRRAMRQKILVEDEIAKSQREHVKSRNTLSIDLLADVGISQTDHTKRTYDYEPFFREYFTTLYNEGKLDALLERNENGRKTPAARKVKP